jgi:hypothetical protein
MIIAFALIATAIILFRIGQRKADERAAKQRHATYLANYVPGRDGWNYGDPV